MGSDQKQENPRLQNVVTALKQQGVTTAHVGIFDIEGGFRERRLDLDDIADTFDNGGTFVNVLHRWDIADAVYREGPFIGESVKIDPDSVRHFPFEKDAALFVADYTGSSADTSPRELLQRQVAKASEMGFDVRCALEFEFIVLQETATSIRDKGYRNLNTFAADNRCWSGQSAAIYSDFVRELGELVAHSEIDLLGLGLELGPGCFEATLRAASPIKAADDAALFKSFTRAFCRRRDLTASFMAQLSSEFPGLSGHVHLSLTKKDSGANAFYDAAQPDCMSKTMQAFVGGLTTLVPDTLALCAHTTNAYRRLVPGNWAPRTATWAIQNYAAAVRVVSQPESKCRLEFRLPAADTNPHLALAMTLGEGLWGIEHGVALASPLQGGGPTDTPKVGTALPHDLFEAAARLESNKAAREIFGDTFVDHFV
ncbi:MAG: glutamine synthetase, partial [Gammaproteobacteria bacterium]|nr:glutamine synthetase [Gammaproteobacteria bacterium]